MGNRRWTPDELEYLQLFYATLPMDEQVHHLNRTVSSIHNKAWELGLNRPHETDWSQDEINFLHKNYAFQPTRSIVDALQRSYESVRMMAQRLGIAKERRGYWYSVNSYAFDELTPETAYTLGFILADGYIRKNELSISQAERDILEKIRDVLASDHPIHKDKEHYVFNIRDEHLVRSLSLWGITEKKSLTVHMPNIPHTHLSHFIRGYFDGDGCISQHGSTFTIHFGSGSPYMLPELQSRLAEVYGLPIRSVYQRKQGQQHFWDLRYHGAAAVKLGNIMYDGAGLLYLHRKREAFYQYQRHFSAMH